MGQVVRQDAGGDVYASAFAAAAEKVEEEKKKAEEEAEVSRCLLRQTVLRAGLGR